LTKGKYNLLISASFENGQSILVSKLFDDISFENKIEVQDDMSKLILLATAKLNQHTLAKLHEFISSQKKVPNNIISLLSTIITNED
jgi:hypothetical protein